MRLLFFLFVFLLTLSVFSIPVFAESGFNTDYDVVYTFLDTGGAQVEENITLTNMVSNLFAHEFTLSLPYTVGNVKAYEQEKSLPVLVQPQGVTTQLIVTFPDKVVGVGKKRSFTLSFSIGGIAVANGAIREIIIPPPQDTNRINSYQVRLVYPPSYGTPSRISPQPNNQGVWEYSAIKQNGIVATFGIEQYAKLHLYYTLFNDTTQKRTMEITIPPQTAFQEVSSLRVNPRPENLRTDLDGNWLAQFTLSSREEKEITVDQNLTLFSTPHPDLIINDSFEKSIYRATQPFWELTNGNFAKKAQTFANPEEIYTFLSSSFSYGYSRLAQKEATRWGATKALESGKDFLCMEFADSFVALARAQKIPSRVVQGYAYTNNQYMRPLSVATDVLHAWVEYFDEEKNLWIPMDPTWGKTSGGVNYRSRWDTNHIAFAILGQSSTTPLPAGSFRNAKRVKDVEVTFQNAPFEETPARVGVYFHVSQTVEPEITQSGEVEIRNESNSPFAIHSLSFESTLSEISASPSAVLIPPYGKTSIPFFLKTSQEGRDTLKVLVNGRPYTYTVSIGHGKPLFSRLSTRLFLAGVVFFVIVGLSYGRTTKLSHS